MSLNERLNFLFILCLTIWKFFDFLFSRFVLPSFESLWRAPNFSRPSAPALIVANLSSLFCFFFLLTLVIALWVIKLSLQKKFQIISLLTNIFSSKKTYLLAALASSLSESLSIVIFLILPWSLVLV